jgi:hypothetical protein
MKGKNGDIIDGHLVQVITIASASDTDVQQLVSAGVIHTLILLLKLRVVDPFGLEAVLIALGVLAYVLNSFFYTAISRLSF